jgi:transposase
VLAYTIAAEIGDIDGSHHRASSLRDSRHCARVYQPGERDLRGPLSKQGPRYLRQALVEAATHACTHPVYRDRYQQTKARSALKAIQRRSGEKSGNVADPPSDVTCCWGCQLACLQCRERAETIGYAASRLSS